MYASQEKSLRKLFKNTYPENLCLDNVLIKVASLNTFYKTRIFVPFYVAEHIVDFGMDQRLSSFDLSVVNDIANVQFPNRQRRCYSFFSKYCHFHYPKQFPIYDTRVEKMLINHQKQDNFSTFTKKDLKDYPTFHAVYEEFQKFYGLQSFTFKEIDNYFWQA